MGTEKIKSFVVQCGRVWQLLTKPSKQEFKTISIVSAIGLGVVGLIGFLIAILMTVIFPK